MSQKSGLPKPSAEKIVKDIRRATRKQYGAEEKIRIVLEGLRGEESIATLCRRPRSVHVRTHRVAASATPTRSAGPASAGADRG